MSEQYRIEITPEAQKVLREVDRFDADMIIAVARAQQLEDQNTLRHIFKDYLSFPSDGPTVPIGLRAMTGRLRGSLYANKPAVVGGTIESTIGTNTEYAAIHEFGGTIPAHDIVPKKPGGVLRFIIDGRVVFAKKVHIGERVMPARAPIQNGIRDRLPDYSAALSAAIVNTWRKN